MGGEYSIFLDETGLSYDKPKLVKVHEEEACFGSALPSSHPFFWARVMEVPKADHGTYSMRWMRTLTYHLLHTGGFLRMATERGRVYWLAQNEMQHTTPDRKIHFSIDPRGDWDDDIGEVRGQHPYAAPIHCNIISCKFTRHCAHAFVTHLRTS